MIYVFTCALAPDRPQCCSFYYLCVLVSLFLRRLSKKFAWKNALNCAVGFPVSAPISVIVERSLRKAVSFVPASSLLSAGDFQLALSSLHFT